MEKATQVWVGLSALILGPFALVLEAFTMSCVTCMVVFVIKRHKLHIPGRTVLVVQVRNLRGEETPPWHEETPP